MYVSICDFLNFLIFIFFSNLLLLILLLLLLLLLYISLHSLLPINFNLIHIFGFSFNVVLIFIKIK